MNDGSNVHRRLLTVKKCQCRGADGVSIVLDFFFGGILCTSPLESYFAVKAKIYSLFVSTGLQQKQATVNCKFASVIKTVKTYGVPVNVTISSSAFLDCEYN
jgi:hypothetical protein